MGSEQMLTYQRQYLNRETLTALVGHCFEETYAYSLALDEKTIQPMKRLEVGKAGSMVLHIGLLSPDMGCNCQEWIRTSHRKLFECASRQCKAAWSKRPAFNLRLRLGQGKGDNQFGLRAMNVSTP